MIKIALAFSGGKDSWACLWLNAYRLDEIAVVWVNTGKNYPEMLETIEKARAMCPNFFEIAVDRDLQNAQFGMPSDIVPVNWTQHGQVVHGPKDIMIQSYLNCCLENIGMRILSFCKQQGIERIIKGQRKDEQYKSGSYDGCIIDGMIIEQPIESWTKKEVLQYVGMHMPIPDHFRFNHSSMDCYDCTAFSKESKDRVEYTKEFHPVLFAEYDKRKTALSKAITEALKDENG